MSFRGTCVSLVGCDEENGSSDLAYYRKKESLPPRVFTPDGSFPVIHLEKGMIRGKVIKKIQSDGVKTIVSASGGVAVQRRAGTAPMPCCVVFRKMSCGGKAFSAGRDRRCL